MSAALPGIGSVYSRCLTPSGYAVPLSQDATGEVEAAIEGKLTFIRNAAYLPK